MSRAVTLLTDFGTRNGYVAVMKGILVGLSPDSPLHDASHGIVAGDVEGAGLALARYWRRYPVGTVHLVVVDPGVGTDRRALAVEAEGRFIVAPDNGVLERTLEDAAEWKGVVLDRRSPREGTVARRDGSTFHGRDVFAPAAGRLARGDGLEELGPPLRTEVVRLTRRPPPVRAEGRLEGHVVEVDRFGNLITDLPGAWLPPPGRWVVLGEGERALRIPVVSSYAGGDASALVVLVNSDGLIEVAVRDGSARATLSAARGSEVRLLIGP